ncbi:hypothetical protein HDC36_003844 [Xanthomonas sp. JAI131]|uniref:hypothetical protein n=1 Tax=Xanthomonas sp. JAI131 TaxID=2723067 RepID=UPI0015CEC676|nr:hypothetical protein [Xanthomonas sp. JAI131]NYF22368.1 hypothetical protein [Xanthomonas sp. JAI131]
MRRGLAADRGEVVVHRPAATACPDPASPLRYPPGYPPTGRRERFFIGVRWLGPDLSFFGRLSAQQKARSVDLMELWGGGTRQRAASAIGAILARRLRWPGPCFLPDDVFAVVCGGPRFEMLDTGADVEDAIGEIQTQLGVALPASFWEGTATWTLGEVVDALLAAGAAWAEACASPTPG